MEQNIQLPELPKKNNFRNDLLNPDENFVLVSDASDTDQFKEYLSNLRDPHEHEHVSIKIDTPDDLWQTDIIKIKRTRSNSHAPKDETTSSSNDGPDNWQNRMNRSLQVQVFSNYISKDKNLTSARDKDEFLEARDQVTELKLQITDFSSCAFPPGSILLDTPLDSSHSDTSSSAHMLLSNLTIGTQKLKNSNLNAMRHHKTNTSAPNTPGASMLLLVISANDKTKSDALSAHEICAFSDDTVYQLNDFSIIRPIGKGGFAKVFLVRLKRSSGKYFALKCVRKSDIIKVKQEKQIMNEKNILSKCNHPFIIDLFYAFQNRTHLFMALEFLPGGDLYSLLKQSKSFKEDHAKFYISEVIIALDYLHSINVVFRDLKPENVLLDITGHIKLADFGFARVLFGKTRSFCGTPDYIAWEIVAYKHYDYSVDWWSLGVLIFELVSGKTPFRAKTAKDIYQNIIDMNIQWTSDTTGTCMDLIQRLLVSNYSYRLGYKLGAIEIKSHPWFNHINWKKLELRQVESPIIPQNIESPEELEKELNDKGTVVEEFQEVLDDKWENKFTNETDPFIDF